jgi:hypothetical protein
MTQFAPYDGVRFPMPTSGPRRTTLTLMGPIDNIPTNMRMLMQQFYCGTLPAKCTLGDTLMAGVTMMLITASNLVHTFEGCPMWIHDIVALLPATVDDHSRITELWRVLHDQVGITRDAWRLSDATRTLQLAINPPRPIRRTSTPFYDRIVQRICEVAAAAGFFPIPLSDVTQDGTLIGASAELSSHRGWRMVTWDNHVAFSRPRGAVECEPMRNRTVYAVLTLNDGTYNASVFSGGITAEEMSEAGVLQFNLTKTSGMPLEVNANVVLSGAGDKKEEKEEKERKVIGLRDCVDAVMAEVLQMGASSASWDRTSIAMLQERVRCDVHFAVRKHGMSDAFTERHSEIVYKTGNDKQLVVPIVTIKSATWGKATPTALFAMRPNEKGGHTVEFDFEHEADLQEVFELTAWQQVDMADVKPAMPYSAPRCSVSVLIAP